MVASADLGEIGISHLYSVQLMVSSLVGSDVPASLGDYRLNSGRIN